LEALLALPPGLLSRLLAKSGFAKLKIWPPNLVKIERPEQFSY
jgi:hypothetical protein